MSKIGKRPVQVPTGVTATVQGQQVKMKGPKGELSILLTDEVGAKLDKGAITIEKRGDTKRHAAIWGMTRAMIANLVEGVTKGYEKKLEINGVGYRAAVAGKNLQLALGYSHDVLYPIPQGITITTPKPTEITITPAGRPGGGGNSAATGNPSPYKGKGIKYAGEYIFRKEGKKK